MLDAHRLSLASLEATAEGSSDPALVARLELAYRSRQLTLLRAVLDRTERLGVDLSPLSPLGNAWTVLAEAQRLDAGAVDMVISLPGPGCGPQTFSGHWMMHENVHFGPSWATSIKWRRPP